MELRKRSHERKQKSKKFVSDEHQFPYKLGLYDAIYMVTVLALIINHDVWIKYLKYIW